MKSVTSIHHNSGATITYAHHEYIEIIRNILSGVTEIWLSEGAVDEIIALAHEEATTMVGASASTEFMETSNGVLVSSYFLDSLLALIPSHNDGYMLHEIRKQYSEVLYTILAKELEDV